MISILYLPERWSSQIRLRLLKALRHFGLLFRLLHRARRARQHSGSAEVDIRQLHAMVRQLELADLVRVRHAARLQDVNPAIALTAALDALEQKPGVHERRDAHLGLLD